MRPQLFAIVLALVCVGLGGPASANAAQPPRVDLRIRVLANGLKVVSVLDRSTPNVAVQVWYGVGSRNDPPGRSGFAHLFEHLMFKGTRNTPPEYMSGLTSEVGGDSNASTDSDYTEFDEVVPAASLDSVLWAEADRMRSLAVDHANFLSERAVVEAELREETLSDSYDALFSRDIPRAGFAGEGDRRPTIGSISDLEAATLAEAKAFHARYYRPDDASLVIVGDFDPVRLDASVDRYFGGVRSSPALAQTPASPHGPRTSVRVFNDYAPAAPTPAVALVFAGPSAASADRPALEVLRAILSEGEAGRLAASLVRSQALAVDVFSDIDLRRDAGLIDFGAILADRVTLSRAEAALRAQLVRLRVGQVTAAELRTAKNQLLAERLKARETIADLASEIGSAVTVEGDANRVNTDIGMLWRVTAQDVRRVARLYLADRRATVVRYHAGPARRSRASALTVTASSRADGGRSQGVEEGAAPPRPPAAAAPDPAAALRLPKIEARTLPNGLRVIVARTTDVPLATANLTFWGGAAADPPAKLGLANLTAELARRASARSTASLLQALGYNLSITTGYDSLSFTATGLSQFLPQALAVLGDLVRRPVFAERELRRLRGSGGLTEASASADSITDAAVGPLVFGRGPYGHIVEGTQGSLQRISRRDVMGQRARQYRPDNAVLVLAGNIDRSDGLALAKRVFGDWTRPAAPPARPTVRGSGRARTVLVDVPDSQVATVTLATVSVGRLDPRRFAVEVANAVLGGGYASRLSDEIRVRRGLTYDASSTVETYMGAGLLSATAKSENAHAPEVASIMMDQLAALCTRPPDGRELSARKAALIGDYARSLETSEGMAARLATNAVYGDGPDELGNIRSG
ncbi:MAG: insulinase family protein [Caulobacteraceae bacterium]|nr:insulinase family protein [Caulobacteraceae bacterium]